MTSSLWAWQGHLSLQDEAWVQVALLFILGAFHSRVLRRQAWATLCHPHGGRPSLPPAASPFHSTTPKVQGAAMASLRVVCSQAHLGGHLPDVIVPAPQSPKL